MRLTLFLLLLASASFGQVHVVQTVGVDFVDSVGGDTLTIVQLGQTIEWQNTDGVPHTVTSGTGSGDPSSGALFNVPLDSVNPVFQYTPTASGALSYYCAPHEALGMAGTIIVQDPAYPGNGSDVGLEVSLGGVLDVTPGGVHDGTVLDVFTVRYVSPGGSNAGVPFFAAVQAFPTGSVTNGILLTGDSAGPVIIDLNRPLYVIFNGLSPGPITVPVLGASTISFIVPPVLAGQGQSLIMTALLIDPTTGSGFGNAPAHEIRIL